MYVPTESNKQKNKKKNNFFVGIVEVTDEKAGSGFVNQMYGSGSVPKCHGSGTLAGTNVYLQLTSS